MPPPSRAEEWHNGNEYKAFAELMTLVKISDNTFESGSPAYSPGGFTRAYGGHVYAQAPWAAAHTVRKGFVLHVCT
jgi:acyl-CoA thioesterase